MIMKPFRIGILILIFAAAPALALAHGGEKHDDHDESATVIEEQPAVGSPFKEKVEPIETAGEAPIEYTESEGPVDYGASPEEKATTGDTLQPSLGLEGDPLGLDSSGLDQDLEMDMQQAGHDMAGMKKKKHVEQATHEMVSTSNKGYGLAVGITVLSGLAAGILFLKRPTDS